MSRTKKLIPGWVVVSAVSIGLLGSGYGVATAATGKGATKKTTRGATKPGAQRANETPLTGDTLAKVSAAALAKVSGGKVVRAETDGDGKAAYEVHMTNASGAAVTVYVDEDFAVVSVDTSTRGGGKGHHGGARSGETPLTGDTLAKASAAALARVSGGKVVRAETDADGKALYEVHMTNVSGAPVTVYLDKDFGVVSFENGS